MSKHIETLKLALEALEKLEKHNRGVKITTVKTGEVIHPAQIAQEAITAIKEALAQPEQEPVAFWNFNSGFSHCMIDQLNEAAKKNPAPLYTSPPQRTWQGLTDEDISEIVRGTHNTASFVRAIEAKLKQKNGFAEENT